MADTSRPWLGSWKSCVKAWWIRRSPTGTRTVPAGCQYRGQRRRAYSLGFPFRSEADHAAIRLECRALAVHNEFAINGHENRISYIVGTGHSYRVVARPGRQLPESLLWQIQEILARFLRRNMWHRRQQEIVRRRDRDGEVFLRFFPDPEGTLLVRFVEPEQISTPTELQEDPTASFGIVTRPRDVESVLGYFVDGEYVPAGEIQHRKAHVDFNVKRGLPLFYPVRKISAARRSFCGTCVP